MSASGAYRRLQSFHDVDFPFSHVAWGWLTRGHIDKSRYHLHYLACVLSTDRHQSIFRDGKLSPRLWTFCHQELGLSSGEKIWLEIALKYRFGEEIPLAGLYKQQYSEAKFWGMALHLVYVVSQGRAINLQDVGLVRVKNRLVLQGVLRSLAVSRVHLIRRLVKQLGDMMRIKTDCHFMG